MQEPELVLKYEKNNKILLRQSKNIIRKYISLAKHLVFIRKEDQSKAILEKLGFSAKSINRFIKLSKQELSLCDEDFKHMLMGKISLKHLN